MNEYPFVPTTAPFFFDPAKSNFSSVRNLPGGSHFGVPSAAYSAEALTCWAVRVTVTNNADRTHEEIEFVHLSGSTHFNLVVAGILPCGKREYPRVYHVCICGGIKLFYFSLLIIMYVNLFVFVCWKKITLQPEVYVIFSANVY